MTNLNNADQLEGVNASNNAPVLSDAVLDAFMKSENAAERLDGALKKAKINDERWFIVKGSGGFITEQQRLDMLDALLQRKAKATTAKLKAKQQGSDVMVEHEFKISRQMLLDTAKPSNADWMAWRSENGKDTKARQRLQAARNKGARIAATAFDTLKKAAKTASEQVASGSNKHDVKPLAERQMAFVTKGLNALRVDEQKTEPTMDPVLRGKLKAAWANLDALLKPEIKH